MGRSWTADPLDTIRITTYARDPGGDLGSRPELQLRSNVLEMCLGCPGRDGQAGADLRIAQSRCHHPGNLVLAVAELCRGANGGRGWSHAEKVQQRPQDGLGVADAEQV